MKHAIKFGKNVFWSLVLGALFWGVLLYNIGNGRLP